jgi:hypothetical protein
VAHPAPKASEMNPKNPYEGRWRWWYSSIADIMLAQPGIRNTEIAERLGKAANTIHLITVTDLFKSYYAERRREFVEAQNLMLSDRLTNVATKGLDIVLEGLEKKRDKLPIQTVAAITDKALERLGMGVRPEPGTPSVVVNNNTINHIPSSVLAEARQRIRQLEAQRLEAPIAPVISEPSSAEVEALFTEIDELAPEE